MSPSHPAVASPLLALLSLALGAGTALGQRAPDREARPPEAVGPTLEVEALQSLLPDSADGWARVELGGQNTPFGPVAQATYGRGERRMMLAVVDLGGAAPDALEAYLRSRERQAEEGEARPIRFGHGIRGYEGTGLSDDVAPPHGAMALPGDRLEVMAMEMVEGLSSVGQVKELPSDSVKTLVSGAREFLGSLDLRGMAERAEELASGGPE